ncbi:MAG: hypothetical protein ACI867_000304 [Glaciecola sp.]
MVGKAGAPSTRRRDLVVALLVVLAMGGVGFLAYDTLGSRVDPPPPDPAASAARFAAAWVNGDVDAMVQVLVRRPGDELTDAMAAFDTLEPTDLRVTVAEVIEGDQDGFATVIIQPELDVPDVGTWAWSAELSMERGRGSWRIRWDETSFHPSLAVGLHFEVRTGPGSRAPILGFDGTPLTSTSEVVTIGIEPSRVPSAERLAESLSTLVPEALKPLQETFARADLMPTWFYPLVTVPAERLAGIRDRIGTLPGIILRSSDGRIGTSPGFGRHLLGQVVDADANLATERGVSPGTPVGRGGLEEDFDNQLRGSPATEIIAVEQDGDVRAAVASFSDNVAESVRTTVDPLVQEAIENALLGRQERIAVVAVGPDGGVLGSASRPLNGYNRAFAGAYAPGAAVWPMTVLAAVANGANAQSTVACPAVASVGGVRFENLAGFDLGSLTLSEAVANGCRSSIARLAGELPSGTMSSLAGNFGFNVATAGAIGWVTPQWPVARDLAEQAASGVGQALLLAPPVHLASVAAAFVDGTWDSPFVLLEESGRPASSPPLPASALAEARAIFEASGAQAGLARGVGLVAGEGSSSEGRLGWASVITDEYGLVVMVELGTRADALAITQRFLAELTALRAAAR